MKNIKKPLIIIFIILFVDQLIKIYIKTHFLIGDEIRVFGLDWFRIHFLENKGMAFGMSWGDNLGKIFLTSARLILSVIMFIYMKRLSDRKGNNLTVYSIALIFAGAVGNIIDSLFYGLIFSESSIFQVATFFPQGGGYAPMMLGKVVDMFYFPLIDTIWPDWVPIVGGNSFRFFNAIFNFADASITIGVCLLIIAAFINESKAKKESKKLSSQKNTETTEQNTVVTE